MFFIKKDQFDELSKKQEFIQKVISKVILLAIIVGAFFILVFIAFLLLY